MCVLTRSESGNRWTSKVNEYIPFNRLSCEKVQAIFTLLHNLGPYRDDHCSISMHTRTGLVESQEAHQL